MKKLLAQKGIKTVSYTDDDKTKHLFAYTDKMLANWIFIELYEVEYFEEEAHCRFLEERQVRS